MGEFVRFEVEEGIGTIRLDRPPMNVINQQIISEMHDVAMEAATHEGVRAVVIWGGESVFAAGADVNMMLGMRPQQARPMIVAFQEAYNVIEDIPKVTVAAINGPALGGGLELALCADIRYAAENARLGQPEILLGIIPGAGGTQRLPRTVGVARAKEMIYSGRHLRSEEAKAIGLVDEVFPPEGVYQEAVKTAKRYAKGPAVALAAAKTAINYGMRADIRTGLVIEREAFADLFSTEDQDTGMRTFLEHGPGRAQFTGK
jgi:enoyl-CoA hydratase/carnithine racemase